VAVGHTSVGGGDSVTGGRRSEIGVWAEKPVGTEVAARLVMRWMMRTSVPIAMCLGVHIAPSMVQAQDRVGIGIVAYPTLRLVHPQRNPPDDGVHLLGGVGTELSVSYVFDGRTTLGLRALIGIPLGELGALAYVWTPLTCLGPSQTDDPETCFGVGAELGYVAWLEWLSESGPVYAGPSGGLDVGFRFTWYRRVTLMLGAGATTAYALHGNTGRRWVPGADVIFGGELRF
jgi:hypothetical protein